MDKKLINHFLDLTEYSQWAIEQIEQHGAEQFIQDLEKNTNQEQII